MNIKVKQLFFVFVFSCISGFLYSQRYFQQEVNYTISVTLDDDKHELNAAESVEYINNSPDKLNFIYFHLWANAYKNNSTALAKDLLNRDETKFYYSKDQDKGFVDQLDFKVNGSAVKWELLKDSIDICKIYLNEPLAPNDTIVISTPFHVKIPSAEFSRFGHIGQSYQITQWYPKPAVYDMNGWNYMPYVNQGEFYSDYGSFDVSITLPKNYVVGATGDLFDGEEELKWLDAKVKETESINRYNPFDMDFPPSEPTLKTLHYKQKNVHDFAFFCDKRYHVLKGEVTTPHDKHKVTTWTMFTNSQFNFWRESIKYINDAIYYYSLWNGDYPYNNVTAVDGTISAGGGMEYPNITVIGSVESAFDLDLVIAHEVGHNWFYGMLGTNERIHPWMDEGINSFNEHRYVELMYPNNRLLGQSADNGFAKIFDIDQYTHKKEYELLYTINAAKNQDQPIELPATKYTSFNYGGDVYSKTALAFNYLKEYLGEDRFDEAMQTFFEEWKFKHPTPFDLRRTFEEKTNKDLSWFFDDVIKTTKKIDYKIAFSYQKDDGSWRIGIKNKGDIASPVFINGITENKLVATVIYDGFKGKSVLDFPPSEIDYFKIDYADDILEINRNNNTIRNKGIFKKVEPLRLQFLGSLDNPEKTQLFYSPVAGWNNYNKFMLGMVFHNVTLPQKKFEYELMPMYSFNTKDMSGYGKLAYNIYSKNNLFQQVTLALTGSRYAYTTNPFAMNFNKIAPELNIEFKKRNPLNPYTHELRYRNVSIIQDAVLTHVSIDTLGVGTYSYSKTTINKNYNDITYTVSKKHAINPYVIKVNVLQGEHIIKPSLTAIFTHNFKEKNKNISFRFFAGTFFGTKAIDAVSYRYRLSGQRGYQDYLYDNIYLGRTETSGVWANQFTETDGAFKFYSPLGQTSKWITAFNVKSSLGNMKLPLNLFMDLGITGKDGRTTETLLYDAGVYLPVIKDIFEVYFPVLICQGFKDYKSANNLNYYETIRFTLNLNILNPFDFIKKTDLL